jgi:Transposase IS66 family
MTPQSSASIEDLPLSELRRFVSTLASEVARLGALAEAKDAQIEALEASNAALKTEVQDLKDEVARLKGLPPRPKFKGKPSGMEKATSPGPGGKGRSKRRRGPKRDQLEVTSEVVLRASPPAGSRFLGYEDILVQDLKIQVVTVRYRKERWAGPCGERIVAALPAGILGGYGPELRRFIAAGHFQGQMTAERLTAVLGGMGMSISKRQVVRLLSGGLEGLIAEDQAVLRAALETAAWITVDDTGHRHAGKDGVVTQIGDDRFAVFRSGPSKSRRAFLSLLRAGHEDFVVDANALQYMRERGLAGPVIAALAAHPDKLFANADAWQAHLQALGAPWLQIAPDPVAVATEGALWGAIKAHGLMASAVVVSDGAGQFRLADHALCWVHAERLVYKLTPTNAQHHKAVDLTRTLIWWFYKDLKAYKIDPDPKRARALRARFDRIFKRKTGYILLDRLLGRLHDRKAELLRVLERPEIPLHTNGSENDIRSWVTKRKISGGTVSDAGKTARDTMLGLLKTCAKLKVSFYRFLGDRFAVPGAPHVPSLPHLVRLAAA